MYKDFFPPNYLKIKEMATRCVDLSSYIFLLLQKLGKKSKVSGTVALTGSPGPETCFTPSRSLSTKASPLLIDVLIFFQLQVSTIYFRLVHDSFFSPLLPSKTNCTHLFTHPREQWYLRSRLSEIIFISLLLFLSPPSFNWTLWILLN